MIALALDTATSSTVVGLQLADGTILEARDDVLAGERPRHTQRLLALAGELLAQAGLHFRELELIAAGIGPGTFTGLRIGLASARGLAQATGTPLVGVCSLRVLAAAAAAGPVLALIDAGRGEVFAGGYEGGRELIGPTALAPSALAQLTRGEPWLAVGSGALRFREQVADAALSVPPDESQLHRVSAGALLRLAQGGDVDARGALIPLYVRLPDAELALRGAKP